MHRWQPETRQAFESLKSDNRLAGLQAPKVQVFEKPLRKQRAAQINQQLKDVPIEKFALITKVVDGS